MDNNNERNANKEIVYVQSPQGNSSMSAMTDMLNAIMPILMLGVMKDVLKH